MAGNYAADLLPNMLGKKKGFPIGLYLDAKTNSYVEEFSTSNFVAVDAKGAFVTPNSPTVLPSITNKVGRCICWGKSGWMLFRGWKLGTDIVVETE